MPQMHPCVELACPRHSSRDCLEHLFDLYLKYLLFAGYDEVFPIVRQPDGSSLLNLMAAL